jgi:two-component system OmpR family response regulator
VSIQVMVVEDEPKVERFVRAALEREGMHVESTDDMHEIINYLGRLTFDVLVMDRMLGHDDTLQILPKVRKDFPKLKILILSALGDSFQKTNAINVGADDYLSKPFHVPELVARVRALTRREEFTIQENNQLKADKLEIILDRQEVICEGKTVELSSKEFKLLSYLMRFSNRIHSREELLDSVWGLNSDPGSNIVEVTIRRLREKLGETGRSLIHTKRGSGYWIGSKE